MKRLALFAALPLAFCAARAEVVYQNDFSTRTSAHTLPSGEWTRYDYTAGKSVVYTYGNDYKNKYTEKVPWVHPWSLQDGWINGAFNTYSPAACVTNNLAAERPGDTDRPFLAFWINQTGPNQLRGLYYQPIGSSFTNGVLEYAMDMRAPGVWAPTNTPTTIYPWCRFFPAFRKYLRDPDATAGSPGYPFTFGSQIGAKDKLTSALCVAAGSNGKAAGSQGVAIDDPDYWYRFRATANLDTGAMTFSIHKLGTTVPDWTTVGTDMGVGMGSVTQIDKRPTDDTGPIEGLGFHVRGLISKGVVTNMPAVTNIRVGWKARAEDSDFIPCYSNDFRTCWKRCLTPGGTSHAYAAPAGEGVESNVFSSYTVNKTTEFDNPVTVIRPSITAGTPSPVGVDGWRRLAEQSSAKVAVVDMGDDGANVLRVTGSGTQWVVFGNSLGEKITSGKVMISVDARTPDKWWWASVRYLEVSLCDEICYGNSIDAQNNATYPSHKDHFFARAGLKGSSFADAPYPHYQGTTTVNLSDTAKAARGELRAWHRIQLVADLDTQTFDCTWWNLGNGATGCAADFTPTTEPLCSLKNLPAKSGVTDIASFAFRTYSCSNTADSAILYDNIRVWKIPTGGATTNLIYSNDFNTRVRFNAPAVAGLTDANNLTTPECDFWTRRGGCFGGIDRLASGGNAALALDEPASPPVCAVQDIGSSLPRTHVTAFRVDARPPAHWYAGAGLSFAYALFGDGVFGQGGTFSGASPGVYPYTRAAVICGFSNLGKSDKLLGQITNLYAVVRNGGADKDLGFAVDPAHWYRFAARMRPGAGGYDLTVYDQGTAHPAADDANGRVVARASGVSFAAADGGGNFSTVGFTAVGVTGDRPWLADDPGLALFDNVVVDDTPPGLVLTIR